MPSSFLPTATPTPREAAAELRRKAAINDRHGNVWRANHLRNLADRLLAALRITE